MPEPVKIPPGWKKLRKGACLRQGDEYWSSSKQKWYTVPNTCVIARCKVDTNYMHNYVHIRKVAHAKS